MDMERQKQKTFSSCSKHFYNQSLIADIQNFGITIPKDFYPDEAKLKAEQC